ncbi:MAG: hypothetical protein J0H82_04595 [Alphaproteobacteria bacterium]|jgi:hypothetical protein|nr:hypothetical protein [Alphaproteobacteria bacterium]
MTNFISQSRDFGADWDGMWEDFLQLLTDTTDAIEAMGATSLSSVTLTTGAKTFALQQPTRVFPLTRPITAMSVDNGAASLSGTVTASTPGSLTINVTSVTGSGGPYGRWMILIGGPKGDQGAPGLDGAVMSVAGRTGYVTLAVADIAGAAPAVSPSLTGTPTAPTATAGTNTGQIATTAFVATATAALSTVSGRNRIYNGNFRVAQLSGSTTVNSATRVYPIDRWQAFGVASAGTFTVSRSSGASGYPYMLTATVGTAAASPGASDSYAILHRIEGPQVADLGFGASGAQSITLSFIVRSSVTGTFSGSIRNGAANRSWPFTYSVATANTATPISVTITGDTSGTWPITAGSVGLDVIFCLGSGSSGLGAAGNWAAANYFGATGATNLMATAGATWSIANVQLERGTAATTFDFRPYTVELGLCQRYLQVFGEGQSSTIFAFGSVETATTGLYSLRLGVPMMAAPTVTFLPAATSFNVYSPAGSAPCTTITMTYGDSAVVVLNAANASGGMTPGYATRLLSTSSSAQIVARAEL